VDGVGYLRDARAHDAGARNACSKARADAETIFGRMGFEPVDVVPAPAATGTAALHRANARALEEALASFGGDTIFVQMPMAAHSVRAARVLAAWRRRGGRVAVLVHDIESLRMAKSGAGAATKIRNRIEDAGLLGNADAVVVHNANMGRYVRERFGVRDEALVELGLFDYLVEGGARARAGRGRGVAIAGNLARGKGSYLEALPADVAFKLYGPGLDGRELAENTRWMGSFGPEELVGELEAGWGLVWDGFGADGCTGPAGAYLRYNDPHKASLYLTAGLPVVAWSESALAGFVAEHGCGVCVDGLGELRSRLDGIDNDAYVAMAAAARGVGEKMRAGGFLTAAATECLRRMGVA
jgi:hypothetical protein